MSETNRISDDTLARFSVLSRLRPHENSTFFSKLRVYDGETLKDVDPKAKTLQEYRDYAGTDEGSARCGSPTAAITTFMAHSPERMTLRANLRHSQSRAIE